MYENAFDVDLTLTPPTDDEPDVIIKIPKPDNAKRTGAKSRVMRSRTKPGVSVKAWLSESQSRARPVSREDLRMVEEVYASVVGLNKSHSDTIQKLFGRTFRVNLEKTKLFHRFAKGAGLEKLSKDDGYLNGTEMDALTEDVIANHWLPFLREAEKHRVLYGVCAFKFVTVTVQVVTYATGSKKRSVETAQVRATRDEAVRETEERVELKTEKRFRPRMDVQREDNVGTTELPENVRPPSMIDLLTADQPNAIETLKFDKIGPLLSPQEAAIQTVAISNTGETMTMTELLSSKGAYIAKSDGGSGSNGEKEDDSDDDASKDDDRGKARKRKREAGETTLEKRVETVTHQVPVVLSVQRGTPHVYEDNGTKLLWMWNDEVGSIEPFVGWLVFHPPNADGRLRSPVSELLETWKQLKHENEIYRRSVEVYSHPLYVLESSEPKATAGADLSDLTRYVPTSGLSGDTVRTRMEDGEVPRGYLAEDGGYGTPAWETGRLVSSDKLEEKRFTGNDLFLEHHWRWNAWEATCSTRSDRSAETLERVDRERSTALRRNADAHLTSCLMKRPVYNTPTGLIVRAKPGERLVRVERGAAPNSARETELRVFLEKAGSLIGGSFNPTYLQTLNNKSFFASKQKTEKRATEWKYGLTVPSTDIDPIVNEERNGIIALKKTYSQLIGGLFKTAYSKFFESKETWYETILKELVASDISKSDAAPSFNYAFDVKVTFPQSQGVVNIEQAYHLYGLGLYDSEDVLREWAATVPGLVSEEDAFRFQTTHETRDGPDATKFRKRLEELFGYEKEKAKDAISKSSKKKDVKMSEKDKENSDVSEEG